MRKCIVVEIDFLDELQGVYVEFEIYNKQAVIYDAYLISKQVDKEEVYYLPNESHTEGPVYIQALFYMVVTRIWNFSLSIRETK